MSFVRGVALAALTLLAVILQVSLFSFFSYDGVVPNLVLLVVVAAALVTGPEPAMVLGFTGGLLLDLAPPADHLVGRWALSLVLVGFLAGRVRGRQDRPSRSTVIALVTVAASSFVATSVFALSGLLLHDAGVHVEAALRVIPVSVGYDLLLAPFVLPLAMWLQRREQPQSRVPAGGGHAAAGPA